MTDPAQITIAAAKEGIPIRITLDNDCWQACRTDRPLADPDDGAYLEIARSSNPPDYDLLPALAKALGMTTENA